MVRYLIDELGVDIKARRLNMGLRQQDLAKEADVGLRTVQNLESGKNISLDSFLSILWVLGLHQDFRGALALPAIDPIEMLKLQEGQKPVQRVRKKNTKPKPPGFTWGDET